MKINFIRYFFYKLTREHKAIYEIILDGFRDMEHEICINFHVPSSDIDLILSYVINDNPQLFYIDVREYHVIHAGDTTKLIFNYMHDAAQTKSLRTQMKEKMKSIIALSKRSNLTDKVKEKAAYNFLAHNTNYNHEDKGNVNNSTIVGPLIHRMAICEGYAKTFKFLCDILQIPCIVVFGTGKSFYAGEEAHAWNIVKIGSENFQTDITWDSIAWQVDKNHYDYFNVSDATMRRDHQWDATVYPKCNRDMDEVPTINSLNDLEPYLRKHFRFNISSVQVKFANPPADENQILRAVEHYLKSKVMFLFGRGNASRVRYNKNQGKAIITIS